MCGLCVVDQRVTGRLTIKSIPQDDDCQHGANIESIAHKKNPLLKLFWRRCYHLQKNLFVVIPASEPESPEKWIFR